MAARFASPPDLPAPLGYSHVVATDGLPVVRRVRDAFVDTAAPPTSSLVQVAGLFRPDLLVEVEAVAAPR